MRRCLYIWCALFAINTSLAYCSMSAEVWLGNNTAGKFVSRGNVILMNDDFFVRIMSTGYEPIMAGALSSVKFGGLNAELSLFACNRSFVVHKYMFQQKFFSSVNADYSRWGISIGGQYLYSAGDVPKIAGTQTEATARGFISYDINLWSLMVRPSIVLNDGLAKDSGQNWLGTMLDITLPIRKGKISSAMKVYFLNGKRKGSIFFRARKTIDLNRLIDIPLYVALTGSQKKILVITEGILRVHPWLARSFEYAGVGIRVNAKPQLRDIQISPSVMINFDRRFQLVASASGKVIIGEAGVKIYKNLRLLARYEKNPSGERIFAGLRY